MSDLHLGRIIIHTTAARDAIHIAVAPVVAANLLPPAAHVGLITQGGDVLATNTASRKIGVVDPFLRNAVKAGERFWLFLYPNTITALRHEWVHPDFPAEDRTVAAKDWVRHFAEHRADGLSYDEIMAAAKDYLATGAYLIEGGRFEGIYVDDEFWQHYEVITGEKVPKDDRGSFFSCSC